MACGKRLLLISPGSSIGDHKIAERTDELLAEGPDNSDVISKLFMRQKTGEVLKMI